VFVKICGMNSGAAVEAAVTAGADALGFVFADSPRAVTPAQASALCAGLPPTVIRVAVMHHPDASEYRRVLDEFAPDWLQTDAEDLAAIELPAGCLPLPVYRNGRVPAGAELPPRLLFEGNVSGSGRTADWEQARELAAATKLILAGGLDRDNVAAAILIVRPWGVDVSSGVERRRGEKDPAKIKDFIARVRALEET
jgi:phosphoribosylanthranilate isomerase